MILKYKIYKAVGSFRNMEYLEVTCMENFFSRLKGLMFTKQISNNQGALFINKNENVLDSSIHMLFMNFDIAVIWLDNSNVIVDKKIAKKWKLLYYPKSKASKILETHIENFDEFQIGDQIIVESY